uniref:Uncharacterized protein n=1 Tax=viral metagenome TaxID=1070528 RepID=A0A6M3XPC4_9ZZZZ
MSEVTTNGWNEYKRLVIKQLEDMTVEIKLINQKLDNLKTDFTIMKTKLTIIGVVAASIVSIVFQIVMNFLK